MTGPEDGAETGRRALPPLPDRSEPVVIQAESPSGKAAGPTGKSPAPAAVPTETAPAQARQRAPWLLPAGLVLVAVVACLLVIAIASSDDGSEDATAETDQGDAAPATGSGADDTNSVADEADEVSPTAGLSPSEAAVAFVEALKSDSDDLNAFADGSVLEQARADPEYSAFVGFPDPEISADDECSFGDVTQVCLVYLNDPAGGAMAVEVGISVLPPDVVYDPDTGGVTNPDGSPATAVPPRVVSVDMITS